MPTKFAVLRARVALVLASGMLLAATQAALGAPATNIIISQLYGAGGNSGAVLNADYLELFNPTSAPITLTNYSIQYGSASGSTISNVTSLPASVTIAAGGFYLVSASPGTNGAALPAVDFVSSGSTQIAFAAGAGKVALVNTTAKLSSSCPGDPTIVDYIAYGTVSGCTPALAPAPAPSTTLADIRVALCQAPVTNTADFAALAPNPHSSASTLQLCGSTATTSPLASGMAAPNTVFTGISTLLTATVVPGANPTSTGLTVTANLAAIGGSASQPFYDDGTHGDATAGDNVFSFSIAPTLTGTLSLPVAVADSQLRTGSTAIAITVTTPPPFVTIRTIQAAKPSAYATQTITTSGIVTGVKSSGFYLEAADADTNPTTPEGILVYTGSTRLPSYIAVGANVQVSGVVNTYPTTGLTPGTEIDGPQTFSLISAGNPLPAPVTITSAMDSPSGGIRQFSRLEGMRVAIASLTTTSGTDASLTETTETNTSNGQFYGVVTGVPRPFREPGIAVTDTTYTSPIPPGVPIWDSNPELLLIDSLAMGGAAIDLTSNATVTGLVGVMDFSSGSPEILLDAATRPTVTGLMTAIPVPAQAATEFTAASFNMERFYNDVADTDNPGSSAVTVTTAAYQRRLAKASLAIRNVLLMPDLLGLQEIENLAVLTDLSNKISADATAAGQADPKYLPYLFLATDGTAINTGVLVKSTRVDVVRAEQFGLTTTFTNASGSQSTLNDRTPLVVHVGIKRASGPDYLITFIDVHQRSLISVDDPTSTGATVRLKREAQAEFLANLIQGYQAAGEHVISVGDYNGFEFSDGFVDVLGVTKGTPAPATQVVTPPAAGLVNPPLTDLVTLLPAAQRQSYVENGSAQVLDHVVVTPDLVPTETRLVYAHIDSDFPLVDQNDATRPERVSDHDPAVAYFTVPPAPAPVVTLSSSTVAFGTQLLGTSGSSAFTISNTGNASLNLASIVVTGLSFSDTTNCGATLAAGNSCMVTLGFAPGATGPLTGTLTITSNAASSPDSVPLTGTGGDFTIAATAPSVTVKDGSSVALQFSVAGVAGYAGTISLSCSGAIHGETCTVNPVSIPLTASPQTITATVATTGLYLTKMDSTAPPGSGSRPAETLGGVAAAALLGWFHRRRLRPYRRAVTLCAALAVLGALAGCSDGFGLLNPNGTPPGAQVVTISGTANGVTHSTTVTVTVQ